MKYANVAWRKRFALMACAAGLVAMLAGSGSVSAQKNQGRFITEASERLVKLINKANNAGYTLQNDKFSIGGGWIKQSKEKWVPLYTLNLEAGKKYRFLAAGDADAKDVDLEIRNADGKLMAADKFADPEAIVDFAPESTGKYKISVRLFASRNDLPCVVLAIAMTKK